MIAGSDSNIGSQVRRVAQNALALVNPSWMTQEGSRRPDRLPLLGSSLVIGLYFSILYILLALFSTAFPAVGVELGGK